MSHQSGPKIYLVAAVASNGVIGVNGQLPWHLPEDLQHFKRITMGHPIIMGRRTWESLKKPPLPGRENIVVTRNRDYDAPGASVATSLASALALCAGESVAFVIGGQNLFEESLPIADGLVMTEIDKAYEGDTYFPAYDRSRWKATQREDHAMTDGTKYSFVLYEPT